MNRSSRPFVYALAASLVAASLAACGTTPAVPGSALAPTEASPNAPTAPTASVALPLIIGDAATVPTAPTGVVGEALPNQFDTTLRGTIGDMTVRMALQRNGDELRAQYFDEQTRSETGFQQSEYLFGNVIAQGTVRLSTAAFDEGTTVLSGTLQPNAADRLVLDGTWTAPEGGQPLPVQLTEVLPPQTSYTITTKTTYFNDQKRQATYKTAYPRLEGAGAAGEAFNQLVEDAVSRNISVFQGNVEQIITDTTQLPGLSASSIEISYETTYASERLLSVLFHEYSYFAGAAHPNSATFAVTYDLANNRPVELADLFTPGSDYLSVLSARSLEKLRTRDFMLFEEGATPQPENFRSWNVEEQGLRITFDPYQVAAYAAGPQVLFLPYSTLEPIIDPQGPLQAVMGQ